MMRILEIDYTWPPRTRHEPEAEKAVMITALGSTGEFAIMIGEPDDNCEICQAIKAGKNAVQAIKDGILNGAPNAFIIAPAKKEDPCP